MSVRSRPVEKAAHSAPRELLTTRHILREIHASTDTVEDSTTRRSIRAVRPGSVRGREPDNPPTEIGHRFGFAHQLVEV